MASLQSRLDRIRQKPESVRIRYLFVSVGTCFVIISMLWVVSLKASIGTLVEKRSADAVRKEVRDITEGAPESLEALMKAGEALSEKQNEPPEKSPTSAPETRSFLETSPDDKRREVPQPKPEAVPNPLERDASNGRIPEPPRDAPPQEPAD